MSASRSDIKLWKEQDNLVRSIEKPFARDVANEKNRFILEQSEKLPSTRRISFEDFEQHKFNMQKIFNEYYRRTIRTFMIFTEKTTKCQDYISLEKKASIWEFFYVQWLSTWGGAMAGETAMTTSKDINSVLAEIGAAEEAVSSAEITRRILDVRGFSVWRANTIARTETGKAASFASIESAKNISATTGLQLKKRWIPAQDERTRLSHSVMGGTPGIAMEGKFIVQGERLDRPKDPMGSASNVINCRCVLVYETE